MELTPPEYRCADDGRDLTELVRDELADRVPASMTPSGDEFRVIVRCPGGSAAHRVGVTGVVRYGSR